MSGYPAAPPPLPAPVIDNHCHLDISRSAQAPAPAPAEAIAAATAVGVDRMVHIGCDLERADWAVATAAAHPQIVVGVGLHPNEAPRLAAAGQLEAGLERIEALLTAPGVRAVGETGLDYYRTGPEGHEAQKHSFRRHIELAHTYDRTLVIHDREAHADVLATLLEVGAPPRWVMHCFSGDADFAAQCLEAGGYLSFAGPVTFPNAPQLREAVQMVPLDRLLVETDAPYLTPMPHRGEFNAPYLIPHTVRAMAQLRGEDLAELCHALRANTFAAYGGSW